VRHVEHGGVGTPRGSGMSMAQETALVALRAGRSFPQAAEQEGVHRIPRGERPEALEGRSGPEFNEDLRAAIDAAERREAPEAAADATTRANPDDASQAGAGEQVPADEDKLRPEREMGRSAGANSRSRRMRRGMRRTMACRTIGSYRRNRNDPCGLGLRAGSMESHAADATLLRNRPRKTEEN
jgi:hypothetical protein